MIKRLLYLSFLFSFALLSAQEQRPDEVATQVDRDLIKIGEEVKLGISVETTPGDLIIFPEQQTMGAMEVLESYPVDSLRIADKIRLFKQYGITQFDSGDYWVPRLEIIKNDRKLLSDSILVSVREVVVDTTKQGMFPIKDSVEIDARSSSSFKWWYALLLYIPIIALIWLLSRKRNKKSYEETLQPYEWTKYRLQLLDESGWLENRQWKEYYTELTYIIRVYIDSKVYGHTLESTTGQLIKELKTAMSEKGMHITDKTQSKLEEILQKADLVKFATASGDAISAKEDRQSTHNIIENIHKVLPPPTEEELMQDAKYRRKQEVKKMWRNLAIAFGIGILGIAIGIGVWGYISGYDNVKDEILGNSQRDLVEQTWLTSEYGMPPVQLSAPDILVRQDTAATTDQFRMMASSIDQFTYGQLTDEFYVALVTFTLKGDGFKEDDQLPAAVVRDLMTKELDDLGATDILMLEDEVEIDKRKGVTLQGTFNLNKQEYEYEILMIANRIGLDQIMIVNKKDDEEDPEREYGRILRERVRSSISFPDFMQNDKKKKQ